MVWSETSEETTKDNVMFDINNNNNNSLKKSLQGAG